MIRTFVRYSRLLRYCIFFCAYFGVSDVNIWISTCMRNSGLLFFEYFLDNPVFLFFTNVNLFGRSFPVENNIQRVMNVRSLLKFVTSQFLAQLSHIFLVEFFLVTIFSTDWFYFNFPVNLNNGDDNIPRVILGNLNRLKRIIIHRFRGFNRLKET